MTERWSSISRIVALGLDGTDGHRRVTRGPFYQIYEGSEQTHEALMRLCMKVEAESTARDGTMKYLRVEDLVSLLQREAESIENAG